MLNLTQTDKQSDVVMRLMFDLETAKKSLLIKCGRVQDSRNAQLDALKTAEVRGRIKQLNVLIKELTTGREDASSPVTPRTEMPSLDNKAAHVTLR